MLKNYSSIVKVPSYIYQFIKFQRMMQVLKSISSNTYKARQGQVKIISNYMLFYSFTVVIVTNLYKIRVKKFSFSCLRLAHQLPKFRQPINSVIFWYFKLALRRGNPFNVNAFFLVVKSKLPPLSGSFRNKTLTLLSNLKCLS